MRSDADPTKIRQLLRELGRRADGPGRIYLTGGASALLEGWRASTVDVDLKLDPEPPGVFEAIGRLKNELDLNVELASPDQFLPPLPGWREHSTFIARHEEVEFFHYDFRAQALSKLARGQDRDLLDVNAMIERGLVEPAELYDVFQEIEPELIRYPSLDADALAKRVTDLLEEIENADD